MKKRFFVLLLIAIITSCESKTIRTDNYIIPSLRDVRNTPHYERVVIFGVDGAGGAFENIESPCFDEIFMSGSINYHGIAQLPTMSGENWCSMFYGVTANTHEKTNAVISENIHDDDRFPSVVKTYSTNHHDCTFCSIVNWSAINYGLFEELEELTKMSVSDIYPNLSCDQIDDKVSDLAIERVKNYDDKITFLHFGSVDYHGHVSGSSSQEYINAIKHIDSLIGSVYNSYCEKGLFNTTLFICVSDHGHLETGGHGQDSEIEKSVMFAANGGMGNIIKGTTKTYYTHYLASVILYALGETQPSHYEGGVPINLFAGL